MIKRWAKKIYDKFIEEDIELKFVDRTLVGPKGLDGVSVLQYLINVPESKIDFIYQWGAKKVNSAEELKNQERYLNHVNVFSIADDKIKDSAGCEEVLKKVYFQVENNIKKLNNISQNQRILNIVCCNLMSREEREILFSGLKSLTQGIVYYYGGAKRHKNIAVNTLICNDLIGIEHDILFFLNPLSYHIIGECIMLMP